MNKLVNKSLLAGDKFISESISNNLDLLKSRCRPFITNKKRRQNFKETGDSRYIYQNKLDKACFQHDMAYGDFKDKPLRTTSDRILLDKAFKIDKNPKYRRYERGLA